MQPLDHPGFDEDDAPQMAKLDPSASKLKYRFERLLLTPLFRFALRVVLPFGICLGCGLAWFAVEDNRAAFNLMLSDIRAAVESRPEFQVKLMAIDGASAEVAEDIRTLLPIDFPISSFDLPLEEMQQTVAALDAVREANLRIKQGGTLQIDVTERVPAVLWRGPDGLEMLDRKGFVVGPLESRFDRPDLPVMAGSVLSDVQIAARERARLAAAGALDEGDELTARETQLAGQAAEALEENTRETLDLVAVSGPLKARIRGLERMGGRRWDVVLDRDQRIMLPEDGAVIAFERTIAMDEAVDMLARDIAAVDLRLPRRPTIRMKENAVQELLRIKAFEAGGDRLE
ncbi:cell division protein FtsQ/DivIB [Pacificoceanicola onchidii]|uniref:cell division protein FtsQ/DivIB n=1 Tax=Pacificoceanicola onchidii TaxID=2562685 RepID=UPI0019807ECF|nr:cell division protein FtsQ/DivIB [Pacificoceanicola onchidii]